jgi:hypothetical protein
VKSLAGSTFVVNNMSMANEEIWKLVTSILGSITVIGAFLYWHFKTINAFKDEIHRIEMKMKDIEQNVKVQQEAADQYKEFYILLNNMVKKHLRL